MDDHKPLVLTCVGAMLLLALCLAGATYWDWYMAGVQAEVYRREGIEMTQWEVFVGARPAERTVNLKEAE